MAACMKFADLTDLFLFLFSVACARHVSFVPNSWVMRSLPRASAEAAVDMPMLNPLAELI
jgi:hypothetical protein